MSYDPTTEPKPNRHERRRIWALVPRAVREQAPPRRLDWLPPRTRSLLTRDITRRNELDRALATARGLAADAPECARFQGVERHAQLDAEVRRRLRDPILRYRRELAGMWGAQ